MADAGMKNGWRSYRFDEMATMVNDRVDNPEAAGVDRYVGLEHLDPESLKIRRWGSPSDVTATKLLFRKGDIIFGRRRVYQRKLAVADFDGICSAHAMVVRAMHEVALPEFLPFFMQTDLFMARAKEISVGSLSPTINWKTLAKQEFALPPLDEQRRMVRVLSAAEEAAEEFERALVASNNLRRSAAKDMLEGFKGSWPVQRIGDVLEVVSGGTPSRGTPGFWGGDIPWVKTSEVDFRVITQTEERITEDGLRNSAAKLCPADSVLIALYGQGPTRGRAAMLGIDAATNQACAVILPSTELDPWFVYFYFESQYETLRALAHGAAQPNLNLAMIKDFPIPVPAQDSQTELVALMLTLTESGRALSSRTAELRGFGKRLVERAYS